MIPDRISKIIVPIDFTVDSVKSLEAANDIAAQHDASLTLVHVIDSERSTSSFHDQDYLMDFIPNLEQMKGKDRQSNG